MADAGSAVLLDFGSVISGLERKRNQTKNKRWPTTAVERNGKYKTVRKDYFLGLEAQVRKAIEHFPSSRKSGLVDIRPGAPAEQRGVENRLWKVSRNGRLARE